MDPSVNPLFGFAAAGGENVLEEENCDEEQSDKTHLRKGSKRLQALRRKGRPGRSKRPYNRVLTSSERKEGSAGGKKGNKVIPTNLFDGKFE